MGSEMCIRDRVYTILQRLVETVESLFNSKTAGSTSTGIGASSATVYQPGPAPEVTAQPAAISATPLAALPSPGSFAASAAAVSALAAATTAATAAVGTILDTGSQAAGQTGAPTDQQTEEVPQTASQANAPSATPEVTDAVTLKSA